MQSHPSLSKALAERGYLFVYFMCLYLEWFCVPCNLQLSKVYMYFKLATNRPYEIHSRIAVKYAEQDFRLFHILGLATYSSSVAKKKVIQFLFISHIPSLSV